MRIGVTGAGGFIGPHVVRALLDSGLGSIRALTRSGALRPAEPWIEIMQGDLAARPDCERFVANLDVVCHLAHTNSPVNSDRDPSDDTRQNLVPTLNLLQAIRRAGTKPHVVYFSSGGAMYKPGPEPRPYIETDPACPTSSYGIQKLAGENYLRLFAEHGDLRATVLRFGNAYGALLPQHRMQGFIGVAVSSVLAGRPVRVFGNLDNVRDYIHLADIGSLVIRALANQDPFTVFNGGTGFGHSVRQVLAAIEACAGKRIELQVQEVADQSLPAWVVLDASKAKARLGWEPVVDLPTGIRGMLGGSKP